MDLKAIFKYDERRLYHELSDTQRRYSTLKHRFGLFLKHFPPNEGFKGVEFSSEDTQLLATFCGKRFVFKFDMQDHQGIVRCLITDEDNDDEEDLEELGRFSFNGEGVTNIAPPGGRDADPISVHEGRGALGIVASFLLAGVASKLQ